MKLSKDQLYTLRHMLGINTPDDRIPRPYRNYAAVNPGDKEFAELERLGAVEMREPATPGRSLYDYFVCTEAGRLAAMRSHHTIRHSKSKRRYAKWLDISDCFPDLTFKDFLTREQFREARENA